MRFMKFLCLIVYKCRDWRIRKFLKLRGQVHNPRKTLKMISLTPRFIQMGVKASIILIFSRQIRTTTIKIIIIGVDLHQIKEPKRRINRLTQSSLTLEEYKCLSQQEAWTWAEVHYKVRYNKQLNSQTSSITEGCNWTAPLSEYLN